MPLTMPRITPQRLDGRYPNLLALGLASGATVYLGGLVCAQNVGTGSSARLVPGKQATGLRALGILDNQPQGLPAQSYTSTTDGQPVLQVKEGCFKFDNSSTDPVTPQSIGYLCYVQDDKTVKASWSGGYSVAGKVIAIDDSTSPTGPGVWVEIGALTTSAPNPTGLFLP